MQIYREEKTQLNHTNDTTQCNGYHLRASEIYHRVQVFFFQEYSIKIQWFSIL